ncbi:protein MFI [Trichomycterus rosablanca]|uniref:protein MFI n=1 Tax=Trichomycterus rosablanca TaxID=2290929 RepID=UPI002F360C10
MQERNVKYVDSPYRVSDEGVNKEEDNRQASTLEDFTNRAAKVIQRTWRKHVNVTVFKYLKRLISFRHQGDPQFLLKYVNPIEAKMLDAAAGVFIRFRLGGTSFPPNIYYKIFTHRPIVDLCASSPKDYTHAGQKRPVPEQVHNGQPLIHDDRSCWYHRVENNGWRLLSGKISTYGDPITQDTSSRRTEFYHCKLIRRQDVERKKKIRKIEWMKKMYDEGALHAQTENKETALLVESSTQGMIHTAEQLGPGGVFDWEVDELIEWTNALNFDEYIKEWKDLAVSKSSVLIKDEQLIFSGHDPCEFTQFEATNTGVEVYSICAPSAHVSNVIRSQYLNTSISDLIV